MFLSNREKSKLKKEVIINLGKLFFNEVVKENYKDFKKDEDLFEQIGMVFLEGRGGSDFFSYKEEDSYTFEFTKDILESYKLFTKKD